MADETTTQTQAPAAPAPAATNGTASAAPWYGAIDDADLRGYAQMKDWKSASDAFKSYRELEGRLGVPAAYSVDADSLSGRVQRWIEPPKKVCLLARFLLTRPYLPCYLVTSV